MITTKQAGEQKQRGVAIRPLREEDLSNADRVMRVAFGTFIGLPDPTTFMGDADYVRTRWRANPHAAFAAEVDGAICGSNFASRWGSVGFFGPLTTHPDLWDRGLGKRLMEPVLACFHTWDIQLAGLFTFAQSAKHTGFYRKFGFWPRFLTSIMSKAVTPLQILASWTKFSELPENAHTNTLAACRELTSTIFEGLDVSSEIQAVADQGLGDTLLIWSEGTLTGFAICHTGPGTEAGSGSCYVKFGAVRTGKSAAADFSSLLDACEAFAGEQNLKRLVAGVNAARHEAYCKLLERGFRTDIQGVAMQRNNEPGYNRPGVLLIDDWR